MFKPLYPRILIGLMLLMSSCSSDNGVPQPPDTKPATPPSAKPNVPSNVPTIDNRNTFVPPRGARYTIYAGKAEGEMHVQTSRRVRDTLKASTKMPDWYVIHEADRSLIYYGYYPSLDDKRAQEDRLKIDLMRDSMGNRPFQQALLVEISSPDPTAPPEWNLANAKGYYTLQIAVYMGSAERKQAAVDTVRAARQGGIEAYYYHSPTASIVCVGTWPQSAVLASDNIQSPRGTDRTKTLMVVPGTSDPELNQKFEDVAKRGNLQLVRNQYKILDPTLEAAVQKFPHSALNGNEMKRVVNGQEVYEHSLIRQIPKPTDAETVSPASPIAPNQPGAMPGYRPELPRAFDPPPQSGGGRLKGIGG